MFEEEYFHIYNRGVDKRSIFEEPKDVWRFLNSIREFNTTDPIGGMYIASLNKNKLRPPTSQLVSILTYCLNKNHFHFIMKAVSKDGIALFMQRLSGGYTKYYNEKYDRSGALFQGKYKRQLIETNEYLLHLSAYVNINDRAHRDLNPDWFTHAPFSSFGEYLNTKQGMQLCQDIEIILEQFSDTDAYKTFVEHSLTTTLDRKDREKELRRICLE